MSRRNKKKFNSRQMFKMADTKFLERKNLENNSKKNSKQGTIHVNVVWQYPTQQQKRVPGSL